MKAKTKRKIKIYFSMDPDLYENFEKHIDQNLLDKSKVIEKLIEEYMKNK
jgi:metal-responsive CopG/Arc/MetJ family transcriptional regulator